MGQDQASVVRAHKINRVKNEETRRHHTRGAGEIGRGYESPLGCAQERCPGTECEEVEEPFPSSAFASEGGRLLWASIAGLGFFRNRTGSADSSRTLTVSAQIPSFGKVSTSRN